ncbi:MAG: hypothetical protein AAGA46_00020 [Cyanobacteria bacterium P01_F01_bin.13]
MITKELFDPMIDMLAQTHVYWKPMGEISRGAMIKLLNQYGAEEQEFGEFCLKMMGEENLSPSDIVGHFKQQHIARSRQRALPQGEVKANIQCEEFIRFVRINRELKAALDKGKTHPTDKTEFHQLWQRPLTDEDRAYAEQRRQTKRMRVMGIDLPIGEVGHA